MHISMHSQGFIRSFLRYWYAFDSSMTRTELTSANMEGFVCYNWGKRDRYDDHRSELWHRLKNRLTYSIILICYVALENKKTIPPWSPLPLSIPKHPTLQLFRHLKLISFPGSARRKTSGTSLGTSRVRLFTCLISMVIGAIQALNLFQLLS